jgi:hypothetical protein
MSAAVVPLHIAEVQSNQSNTSTVVAIVLLVAAIAGAAFVLVRKKRSAPDTPASTVGVADHAKDVEVGTATSTANLAPPSVTEDPHTTAVRPATMSVFLSYRREDSADVAGRIYDRLAVAFGQDQVFKDVDSIPLGVDFRDHLQQVVGRCDVVLAVIGDQWLATARPGEASSRLEDPKDFVRIELESALQRGIPVIPVLVRGAAVPHETELPSTLGTLAYRSGISVRADPDFHRDMDRLIDGVRHHVTSD